MVSRRDSTAQMLPLCDDVVRGNWQSRLQQQLSGLQSGVETGFLNILKLGNLVQMKNEDITFALHCRLQKDSDLEQASSSNHPVQKDAPSDQVFGNRLNALLAIQ